MQTHHGPKWQELVLAAVKHHGQSLADAHESLQGDREAWQDHLHHVHRKPVEDLAEVGASISKEHVWQLTGSYRFKLALARASARKMIPVNRVTCQRAVHSKHIGKFSRLRALSAPPHINTRDCGGVESVGRVVQIRTSCRLIGSNHSGQAFGTILHEMQLQVHGNVRK